MVVCEYDWFDDKLKPFQKIVPFPESFQACDSPKKFSNILSDLHQTNNTKSNLLTINHSTELTDESAPLIRSHKYLITFTPEQHEVLIGFFEECEKLYNLCVDIWTDYKDISDCWMLVKDVVFQHYYRSNKKVSYKKIVKNIIADLKRLRLEYEKKLEEHNKKHFKLKQKIDKEYKQALSQWYKEKREAKQKKKAFKKPRPKKQKLPKIKKQKKPRGKNIKKPAPDEALKAEIRHFCADLKSNRTKHFEDNSFEYELNHKDVSKKQSIFVDKRSIKENGIYVNSLGKLECNNYSKIFEKYGDTIKECVLQYDKALKKYYLYVTFTKTPKADLNDREKIVSLDPGEKIFLTFYSLDKYGKLGEDFRKKIIPRMRLIAKIQSAIDTGKNKEGKRLKNKARLKRRIIGIYRNIKGIVDDLHHKSAQYLCENYDTILLPEFKTKPLISKAKITAETERIKKIRSKKKQEEEKKVLKRQKKMSAEVKFVLNRLSHYRFKKYLKSKAEEYKVRVYDVTEEYTSQACTKCGKLGKEYDKNRTKRCACKYKINRDINGSRNILMKELREMGEVKARKKSIKNQSV